MSLLRKPRKGQYCLKYDIDFRSIAMAKKNKKDFSEGTHRIKFIKQKNFNIGKKPQIKRNW
jgi:hypothetical protein